MDSLVILGIIGPTEIIVLLFTLAIIICFFLVIGIIIYRFSERMKRNDELIDLQKQILEELKKLNTEKK
jgi:cell division protein FtsL